MSLAANALSALPVYKLGAYKARIAVSHQSHVDQHSNVTHQNSRIEVVPANAIVIRVNCSLYVTLRLKAIGAL